MTTTMCYRLEGELPPSLDIGVRARMTGLLGGIDGEVTDITFVELYENWLTGEQRPVWWVTITEVPEP
jgi:hypothetical protein